MTAGSLGSLQRIYFEEVDPDAPPESRLDFAPRSAEPSPVPRGALLGG